MQMIVDDDNAFDYDAPAMSYNESNINKDETLLLFRSDAYLSPTDKPQKERAWVVPLHAKVYEATNSTVRMIAIRSTLEQLYGLDINIENEQLFESRVNQFIIDNERGKWFTLQADTIATHSPKPLFFRVGITEPDGHVESSFSLNDAVISQKQSAASQSNDFRVPTLKLCTLVNKTEQCTLVRLIPEHGISVISDIDDTVKETHVTDRKAMLESTFLNAFAAVPGMAPLYQQWHDKGAVFHYVSSSPWYLYEDLESFLIQSDFPDFSLSLKRFRFRDESISGLFKKGTETKPQQIERIIKNYPARKFVLVGDSSEQDPEVYASIKKAYPEQIVAIYIRSVSDETSLQSRLDKLNSSLKQFDDFSIVGFNEVTELPILLPTGM